jgi:hypothetical protein
VSAMETYRDLKPTPEAEATYRRWISLLNDEFNRHQSADRRSEIVRDELFQIYLARQHGGRLNANLVSETATNVLTESFDPRNATLDGEYTPGVDLAKYACRKPLLWFWQMFDRSPLGLNHWLGFRFRCMLAHQIFRGVGKGVRIYPGVEVMWGYNVTVEDDCIFGRGAIVNDSGPILLRTGSIVAAYSTVSPDVMV